MPRLQPLVRAKLASLGQAGERWQAELPDLVADLEREWSVTVVGRSLPGGSCSYVTRVRTRDGGEAVLKLAIPEPDYGHRIDTIRRAAGRGYVRLLAADVDRRAVLLESLGPSLDRLALPPERTLEILCDTLRVAWQVPPAGPPPHREDRAVGLAELVGRLWEQLDHPCPEPVVAEALACAERRAAAFDPGRCVVVHGDPHPANALRVPAPRPGAESGFVLVDPDGVVAAAAYDLGVAVRGWCAEILAAPEPAALLLGWCRLLAARSGLDATAIWEWGYLERVSSGLYITSFGAEQLGRSFLDAAELLV